MIAYTIMRRRSIALLARRSNHAATSGTVGTTLHSADRKYATTPKVAHDGSRPQIIARIAINASNVAIRLIRPLIHATASTEKGWHAKSSAVSKPTREHPATRRANRKTNTALIA